MITPELQSFVESGVSILVGTRGPRLQPECMRGFGAQVGAGGGEVTVFAPAALAATTRAKVADNGRIAVCFSRPRDHRSVQLKGRVVESRPATGEERPLVERYRVDLARELAFVGVPVGITLRMASWPSWAVRFRVEAVYVQTPGPGAGDRLPGGAP